MGLIILSACSGNETTVPAVNLTLTMQGGDPFYVTDPLVLFVNKVKRLIFSFDSVCWSFVFGRTNAVSFSPGWWNCLLFERRQK